MGGFIKPLWLAAMVLSCLSSPSLAIPDATAALGDDVTLYSDNSHPLTEIAPATEKRKDRIGLRIMPFGASIMSGVGSSTKDG